jgi:hypothetical protein
VDQAEIACMMVEHPQVPRTFDKAINHLEEDLRLKRREAIHKVFNEMNFRGVWKKVSKEGITVER